MSNRQKLEHDLEIEKLYSDMSNRQNLSLSFSLKYFKIDMILFSQSTVFPYQGMLCRMQSVERDKILNFSIPRLCLVTAENQGWRQYGKEGSYQKIVQRHEQQIEIVTRFQKQLIDLTIDN
ncbi:hypothetical protein ABPG74_001541 [Tetrahymena malaccensis]